VRKLVVTENITLDGVIDASGGWFAPTGADAVDQSDLDAALREQAEAADALLLGRVTFEQFRGYWPLQTDDETGVAEYLNNVSKYVVSTTMKDPAWERSTVLSGDLEEAVRELKGRAGRDIVVTGSITLVHELIRLSFVDEFRLFVYPVVVGRGAGLFEDVTHVPKLELAACRSFRSGVVLTSYRTKGWGCGLRQCPGTSPERTVGSGAGPR
jgi:dihydrofolate reductase